MLSVQSVETAYRRTGVEHEFNDHQVIQDLTNPPGPIKDDAQSH